MVTNGGAKRIMTEFAAGAITKSKQLRGQKLEEFLVEQLNAWWTSCSLSGARFIYSQLEFSKRVGVSRETVRKKQMILDPVMEGFSEQRRKLNISRQRQEDVAEIERLKRELSLLKDKYTCLQANHVKIFSALLDRGIDIRNLNVFYF